MCQKRSGDTGSAKVAATVNQRSGQASGGARGRTLAWALGLVTAAALLPGCVVVKPYQRENLAERCMSPGFGDGAELKFRAHWEGSRQGGEGGFGTAGGGCGCN